jgi:thioester reductase-like protein
LVLEKHEEAARDFLDTLPEAQRARAQLVAGDVAAIDIGLAGPELRPLAAQVTQLFHAAEINYLGVERPEVRRVNVEGTANILAFAAECPRLTRLVYCSTALVSGDRVGVVMEDELDEGQSFHDAYEESKFEAEALVQSWIPRLPITVARPSIIVGDSRTGEADRLEGPYYAIVLHLLSPRGLRLPLPGRGTAPLNMVPVDFVAAALVALSESEEALHKTFHLTDPNPLSTRRVFELVAQTAGKKPPLGRIPARLTSLLLRTPGLERLMRGPRQALEQFNHFAIYNCRNTVRVLGAQGIDCPPIESYVGALTAYASRALEERRAK